MTDLLPLSIGIGLVVSLLFSHAFGFTAGGMIVPGYFALFITRPAHIVATLLAALATYALVHAISTIVIVYGKRRTALMVLVGYLIGALIRTFGAQWLPLETADMSVIGYIIPGLIAIWLDRQGVIETFSSLLTASVIVRLLLVVLVGAELQQ